MRRKEGGDGKVVDGSRPGAGGLPLMTRISFSCLGKFLIGRFVPASFKGVSVCSGFATREFLRRARALPSLHSSISTSAVDPSLTFGLGCSLSACADSIECPAMREW